jgi:hypothetical protein
VPLISFKNNLEPKDLILKYIVTYFQNKSFKNIASVNRRGFPCLGAQVKPETKKLGFKVKRRAIWCVLGFQTQLATAGSVARQMLPHHPLD